MGYSWFLSWAMNHASLNNISLFMAMYFPNFHGHSNPWFSWENTAFSSWGHENLTFSWYDFQVMAMKLTYVMVFSWPWRIRFVFYHCHENSFSSDRSWQWKDFGCFHGLNFHGSSHEFSWYNSWHFTMKIPWK